MRQTYNSTDVFSKYKNIVEKFSFNIQEDVKNLSKPITIGIRNFMSKHKNVAIYCFGYHTKMLMADFMYDLKEVKCIIDNYKDDEGEKGFKIIKESKIINEKIDGIILSTYKFKDKIKKSLQLNYPNIDVFDLYDYLKQYNFYLTCEYYRCGHPYNRYAIINEEQIKINNKDQNNEKLYRDLISEYIGIKDFRLASKYAYEWFRKSNDENYKLLETELEELYALEIGAYRNLSDNHVFMICLDGLRRADFNDTSMPKLRSALKTKGHIFSNAYAYSSSTFESLIPAYSENFDMRSNNYQKNPIARGKCRFINEAKKQGRNIHFYVHSDKYVEDDDIDYDLTSRTVTQLLWEVLKDASREKIGLYYVHILYETHYSFSNPYFEDKLLPEGSAMMFDYMEKNGERLRMDYVKLHNDAIRYIDDTLAPVMDVLPCRFVIYADHGNMVLDKNTTIKGMHENYLTCHQKWLEVPLAVSSERNRIIDNNLISLSVINDIIISLLNGKDYEYKSCIYIKFGRSELYNPNFRYLYKLMGKAQKLEAFEGFIFAEGYKLVIYANGFTELFDLEDNRIDNKEKIDSLMKIVKKDITVTDRYDKSGV